MPERASRNSSFLPEGVNISPDAHHELYHDWRKALAFCRTIPDVGPQEPVVFHMFWRQRRSGLWRRPRKFGRKQALPVKAFFATQDLSQCSLVLWSDEDLSGNEWLEPFASQLTCRIYAPDVEARGTPLQDRPALYHQQDGRVWRDSDLFRTLVLHNHGGVYVDMDVVLLRSLGALLDREFLYQWDDFDGEYNGAIMHLRKRSEFARELIQGIVEIPAGESNWGRANFRRAFGRGVRVAVFPSPFFDTDWQAERESERAFRPFDSTLNVNLYDGAFAWHWHNHWDDPIEAGSKFQLLEARIDKRLRDVDLSSAPIRQLSRMEG
ncbi:MAG TPA: glycosyltransferase [Candidatus Eremiobacteraceae bacterium]|nr:glycosyltransferase [Candidatus Eremiobacteraceae bacterium]